MKVTTAVSGGSPEWILTLMRLPWWRMRAFSVSEEDGNLPEMKLQFLRWTSALDGGVGDAMSVFLA